MDQLLIMALMKKNREGLGDVRLINSEIVQYLAAMEGHGKFYVLWHLLRIEH